MIQDRAISFLKSALKSIRENIPEELDLIEAYEKVISDLESYEYE